MIRVFNYLFRYIHNTGSDKGEVRNKSHFISTFGGRVIGFYKVWNSIGIIFF